MQCKATKTVSKKVILKQAGGEEGGGKEERLSNNVQIHEKIKCVGKRKKVLPAVP